VAVSRPDVALGIPPPLRKSKDTLIRRPEEYRKAVEFVARRVTNGGILILLDSDTDCPAELAPSLRAQSARSDIPISVVLAKHEFEAWFLAAAESLRGWRGLPDDLAAPDDPESIRGAKEWLQSRMKNSTYSETIDQAKLAAKMDLDDAAARSRSFRKLRREVEGLVDAITAHL
jgi:hypothetical protein